MSPASTEVHRGGQGAPQQLRLWFNAFIPGDLEGCKEVEAGAHSGRSILPSPGPVDAWFLTDQRDFSPALDASSRMHSEIVLSLPAFEIVDEVHRCDETVQIDPATGEELCREAADTDAMEFSEVELLATGRTWSCRLAGSTKNACLKLGPVKVSPNLDYDLKLTVVWTEDWREVTFVIDGNIEPYPSFEMYAALDDAEPVALLNAGVEAGTTPVNLVGPPTRAVLETIKIKR